MPECRTLLVDLMRHGEVEGAECFRGSTDDPLSENGWRQMAQAAAACGRWEKIITSPLQRCADFAGQLSSQLALPLSVENDFREIHFGAWEGRNAADIFASDGQLLGKFLANPDDHTPPDGEPLSEFRQRVLQGWQRLVADSEVNHLLLVSHGGPIRVIIAHILGMPNKKLLSLEIPHAGISRIKLSFDHQHRPYGSLVFHARQA